MNAVISGMAGKALLSDGKSLQWFDVDDPTKLVNCRQSDVPYLFGEGRDLRVIENAELDLIVKELKSESDLSIALDLALISLDAELEEDIRKSAIHDLNDQLVDDQLVVRLENILYARPLPEDADVAGAIELCEQSRWSNAFEFLQRLEVRQPLIFEVRAAWEVIPAKLFEGYEGRSEFQQVIVREGFFRMLVITRENRASVGAFLMSALLNSSIKVIQNHRQVLQLWVNHFRRTILTPEIKPEIDEALGGEPLVRTRRRGRHVKIDRSTILKKVLSLKATIVGAMRSNDLDRARILTNGLVEYQLQSGEPVHLVKSLCDLAMEAKALGLYSFQLELMEQSISVKPGDSWSWGQYGDALLSAQRLTEALRAYEQADEFGIGAVAKNGRAEVLKALGQLDEALATYDIVIAEYPENVVAKVGRAEVFKEVGRFPEALRAYEEIIADDPDNIISKIGRADVLKVLGRPDEALAAYDAIITEYPNNVIAKTGRAEVLQVLGQPDEALAAYDAIIAEYPTNIVAKRGRAEVFKEIGRVDAALAAYQNILKEHPKDVIARADFAEMLKELGHLDEAFVTYKEVVGLLLAA